jgi:hypothetical protein
MCLREDDLSPSFLKFEVHRFGEHATISLHPAQRVAQRTAEARDVSDETHCAEQVRAAGSNAELGIRVVPRKRLPERDLCGQRHAPIRIA